MMVRRIRKYRSLEEGRHNAKRKKTGGKKELFGGGNEAAQPDGMGNRKMSNGSTGSTKHKWLKAFKSLKTTPTTPPPNEKKQAMYHAVSTVVAMSKKNLDSESGSHQFREYTYRKITPCDACGQVLRGHARQGLRCRSCKANVHVDCANDLQPSQCPSLVPKRTAGLPLLRRQKSTAPPPDETPSNEQRWDLGGDYTSRSRAFGQPLVLSNDTSPSDFGSIAGSVSPTTSMFYTPQHQPRSLPTTPLQRTTSPSRKRGAAGSSATRPR